MDGGDGGRLNRTMGDMMVLHSLGRTRAAEEVEDEHGAWFLRKHGALAFSAVVAQVLIEPSPALSARLRATLRAIGRPPNDHACIGLHYRRGDSCNRADGFYSKCKRC